MANCASPRGPVPPGIVTVTAYDVRPTLQTAGGVLVDPSGYDLPSSYLETIDRVTEEAFSCTGKRADVTVKIPSDWLLNCDGTEQVLPIVAGWGDPRKPDNLKLDCPARWRAILQHDASIVSTPSLFVYKDPLVRLLSGVQNIWENSKLSGCAAPSTGPLDQW